MLSYKIYLETTVTGFQYDEEKVRQITETILENENINKALVNIIIVDDRLIKKLNEKYLKKDTITDVISFVLEKNSEQKSLEGEVYANLEQIQRQALDYNTTRQEEFFRIVIHGLLHLTGYDDHSFIDRKMMTDKENYYLSLVQA